jgi:hypothetical protein
MRSLLRSGLVSIVVVAGLLAMYTPAQAHLQTKTDPNDVGGPLDIKSASFSHRNGVIRISQTARSDWTKQTLNSGQTQDDTFFAFQLDSKGNAQTQQGALSDFLVIIDTVDGELRGLLFKFNNNGNLNFQERVDAARHGRTAKAKFGKGKVDPRDSFIGWNAESYFTNNGACSNTCADRAPHNNLFVHEL